MCKNATGNWIGTGLKLDKIQKAVGLGITGALKTASKDAIYAILSTPFAELCGKWLLKRNQMVRQNDISDRERCSRNCRKTPMNREVWEKYFYLESTKLLSADIIPCKDLKTFPC